MEMDGSERNADENCAGMSLLQPLSKIAGWIGVSNCLGSTVYFS